MNDFQYFRNNTLVDVAYREIKKDITLNNLAPGQKIILKDLSEKYGISETPIKQALNRLLMEGLIESAPRRSMRVKLIRVEEISELFEIRYMMETFYADVVLKTLKSRPEILKRLEKNMKEHGEVVEKIEELDDFYKHYSLDSQFHKIYISCCNNEKVKEIYNNLGTHIYMYFVYGKQSKERMKEAYFEHKAIYEALKAFDKDRLLESIKNHIMAAKHDIYQIDKKRGDEYRKISK